ncbi:MAG: DUF255 domain-containing protein [Alphaproteobacteria bacterium]|nr:DUF255 domain-containing protein [Alphaproteobacteria bacterium]
MRLTAILLALVLHGLGAAAALAGASSGSMPWREWSDEISQQAQREQRFVLLSLQSWWCPWCHVMEQETYSDPEVQKLVAAHFIPVRVDQDSRPDLSQRYER